MIRRVGVRLLVLFAVLGTVGCDQSPSSLPGRCSPAHRHDPIWPTRFGWIMQRILAGS